MQEWDGLVVEVILGWVGFEFENVGRWWFWQLDKGCSLLSDTHFFVYSKRVVTPDGIGPYAGHLLLLLTLGFHSLPPIIASLKSLLLVDISMGSRRICLFIHASLAAKRII